MMTILSILICAVLMRIKGGGPDIAPKWFTDLDGGIVSAFGFIAVSAFHCSWWQSILMGLAWWALNTMSMSEDVSAAGGLKGNWPDGRDSWFGSKILTWIKNDCVWGWISGALRGVFIGVCFAIITFNPWFILSGAAFPLCYFIGISIRQIITGQVRPSKNAWAYGEWIFGGVLGAALIGG